MGLGLRPPSALSGGSCGRPPAPPRRARIRRAARERRQSARTTSASLCPRATCGNEADLRSDRARPCRPCARRPTHRLPALVGPRDCLGDVRFSVRPRSLCSFPRIIDAGVAPLTCMRHSGCHRRGVSASNHCVRLRCRSVDVIRSRHSRAVGVIQTFSRNRPAVFS